MRFSRPSASDAPDDVAPTGRLRRFGRKLVDVLEKLATSSDELDDRISALERDVRVMRAQDDRIGGPPN